MKTVLDTLEWVKAKAERQARIKELERELAEAQADLADIEEELYHLWELEASL